MDFGKIISITVLVFAVETLFFNFARRPFHIPGDLFIDRAGFKFYIPFISALIISIALITLFSMFSR
jgi:hypothetical protein